MRYIGEDPLGLAVSVASFKSSIHVLEEDAEDDALFASYLAAAQDVICRAAGRPFGPGVYEFEVPLWPSFKRWWLPCCPVIELLEVAVDDGAGGWTDLDISELRLVRGQSEPQVIVPGGWAAWDDVDSDFLRVRARCGGDLPLALGQAIILSAKEWFDAGVSVGEDGRRPRLALSIERLLSSQRYIPPRERAVR